MKEQKQSFLERLSGTRNIANSPSGNAGHDDNGILSEKPWSPRVDEEENGGANGRARENDPNDNDGSSFEDGDEEPGLAIDMYEVDNELVIQSMIAGVIPENLHIMITRDMVTIKGKRVAPQDISDEQYAERELYWGKFSREIALPFEIDTENAEAVEKYGLLIIRLPMLDTSRTQELRVKSLQ